MPATASQVLLQNSFVVWFCIVRKTWKKNKEETNSQARKAKGMSKMFRIKGAPAEEPTSAATIPPWTMRRIDYIQRRVTNVKKRA